MIKSTGFLDDVVYRNGMLILSGWVLGTEESHLLGFDCTLNSLSLANYKEQLNCHLPSPDLISKYSSHSQGERARFNCEFSIPAKLFKHTGLIRLTPYFNNGIGQSLYKILKYDIPLPPEDLILAIGGGFDNVSMEFLDYYIHLGHLKPEHRVLDIGCGIGRMAYALSYYLDKKSKFEGFDVVDDLISWPTNNITPRSPNFRFKKVDLYNKWYNPQGLLKTESFKFPYPARSFDLISLCSVFTHLLPIHMEHYLDEISRVLDEGCVVCTAFLLDKESRKNMKKNRNGLQLTHPYGECFIKNPDVPEETIGYPRDLFIKLAQLHGFDIESIHLGSWCGRNDYLSYQDIVVLKKRSKLKSNNTRSKSAIFWNKLFSK
jgi:ubiquinone/menaquinone biosynthesis C-methylase UbiE